DLDVDIATVDDDAAEPALRVGREVDVVGQLDELRDGGAPAGRINTLPESEPGHGAVKQAGVAEPIAELQGRRRPDAALAARGRPVEGDDQLPPLRAHRRRIPAGQRCEAAGA